jgi:hypothetical protein
MPPKKNKTQFWYKVFDTADMAKFRKQWREFVEAENFKRAQAWAQKQAAKQPKVVCTEMGSGSKGPKEKVDCYPEFYLRRGQDGQFYVASLRGGVKKWLPFNRTTKYYEFLQWGNNIPDRLDVRKYEAADLKKALQILKDTHEMWMALPVVTVGNRMIVGGWIVKP